MKGDAMNSFFYQQYTILIGIEENTPRVKAKQEARAQERARDREGPKVPFVVAAIGGLVGFAVSYA
jgi:hypothetical protein